MIPGIDPKIDIVFKKVYGSDSWTDLTVSLINAVLGEFAVHRVVEVELLNPYSERMALDDKLSILDIKARDLAGWLFNVEMQMLAVAVLAPRLLYYWAKVYSQQLSAGDDYTGLRPTISICFVNGVLFPERAEYHTCFRLLDQTGEVCLTEDLVMHVIEIPKFNKNLAELETPLDFWLYFLKNGEQLDADALPAEFDREPGVRKAMGILKMFTQNDMERELYEGRLKAKRDMQTLETQRRMLEAERRTLEAERRTMEVQRDHWQQQYAVANREREAANREREQAHREVKRQLADRISLCQRVLRRPVSPADELLDRSAEELREQAERLERELTEGFGAS
jgi:predicted transposase/invertase (TIGR01784 family)